MRKICTKCRADKSIDEYNWHPTGRYNRGSWCKACVVQDCRERYDRKLAANGKVREVRLGRVSTVRRRQGDVREDGMVFHSAKKRPDGTYREWWMPREKFEERKVAAMRRAKHRYYNDPEYRELERQRNQSESSRARKRSWNKRNAEFLELWQAKRRAKVKGCSVKLTQPEMRRIRDYYKMMRLLNKVHGRIMFHVDHKIPLARGGPHHPDNLQLTTAAYNVRKHVNAAPK